MSFDIVSGTYRTVRYSADADSSRDGKIRVAIETDSDVEFLPPIIAVCTGRGIPLRRNDGKVIWRSEVPMRLSKGRSVFNINTEQGTDIRHMRIFFEKDEDYSNFRFVHPLYRGN